MKHSVQLQNGNFPTSSVVLGHSRTKMGLFALSHGLLERRA